MNHKNSENAGKSRIQPFLDKKYKNAKIFAKSQDYPGTPRYPKDAVSAQNTRIGISEKITFHPPL